MTTLKNKMNQYASRSLLRQRRVVEQRQSNAVVVEGRACVHFCSNDYLGLATHAPLQETAWKSLQTYGWGSGSSAVVAGYYKIQQQVEAAFAEFLNREQALFFNSGYLANIGVLTALVGRESTVLLDKYCHASIVDGILLSRAKYLRYRHQDFAQLQILLQTIVPDWIITEGVFSMEGDITPFDVLASLTQSHAVPLMVDDAHGIGVLGVTGGGVCEHFKLTQEAVPCLITPLGKAFGSVGAIVSGKKELMEAILQLARTYRYTTALPPLVCDLLLKLLHLVKTEGWRRDQLQARIQFFRKHAKRCSLPLLTTSSTPIQCILVEGNDRVQRMQLKLWEQGFFVSGIRPPSVPAGSARIRISLNCLHTEAQIERLIDHIADAMNKYP